MLWLKNIVSWLSNHRYILCMNPKGWNQEKEAEYQVWKARMEREK